MILTRVSGQPQSHQEAKELLAGFAGGFADREIEPRMENDYDKDRIQRDAVQQCQDNGSFHPSYRTIEGIDV